MTEFLKILGGIKFSVLAELLTVFNNIQTLDLKNSDVLFDDSEMLGQTIHLPYIHSLFVKTTSYLRFFGQLNSLANI